MQNEDRTSSMYELVELWQQSGQSQKQFSEDHNLKLATFMYWIKKYRSHKKGETGFARVELGHQTLSATLARVEIDLADGLVIRIF